MFNDKSVTIGYQTYKLDNIIATPGIIEIHNELYILTNFRNELNLLKLTHAYNLFYARAPAGFNFFLNTRKKKMLYIIKDDLIDC